MAKSSRHFRFRLSSSHAFNLLLIVSLLFLIPLFALGIIFVSSYSGHATTTTALSINSIFRNQFIIRNHEDGHNQEERLTQVISWEPRAVIYHNFLSKAECEHLINISEPHLEKSTVVNPRTGESVDSRARTSYGTFIDRHQDAIVSSIEKSISEFTFIPEENGEGIQVLRYEVGQQYVPHQDYFSDEFNTKNGGQRIATVLMYLSNVEEGGETVFPLAKENFSVPRSKYLLQCSKTGLVVKPKMGDALLFWSMKPDATPDETSMHGGCPVIKGTKWSATKWLRFQKFKD
ncbi:unnamed protein product [Rhodiola kirilowii]